MGSGKSSPMHCLRLVLRVQHPRVLNQIPVRWVRDKAECKVGTLVVVLIGASAEINIAQYFIFRFLAEVSTA